MRNFDIWVSQLSGTDRLNIVCFIITMLISAGVMAVILKMKLPIWKLQLGWVIFMDILGVILLITRLM